MFSLWNTKCLPTACNSVGSSSEPWFILILESHEILPGSWQSMENLAQPWKVIEFIVKSHKSHGISRSLNFNRLHILNPHKYYTVLVIPSQQSWRGYSNAAVRGWLGEWVGGWVGEWVSAFVGGCVVTGSVTLYLVDTIATTVFAQSLSNFTCTFAMMRGGALLILGHGVKGLGQLWHSVHKTLWTR